MITPSITDSKATKMEPSLAFASRLHDIASVALLASLAVGVLSTGLVVWMGSVKERHLRLELYDASKVAAEAHARAAESDARAAEAHERGQVAALELAKYRAPRLLSPAQVASLRSTLAPFKGQIASTGALPTTHEGLSFALQLHQVLEAAGLQVRPNQGAAGNVGPMRGLYALTTTGNIKGERLASTFADAMTKLGFPTTWGGGYVESLVKEKEKTDPNVRNSRYHEWVIIVVGDKP
ncbi:MAG: hypothetical protein ABIP93_20905 [Gemmatimonadaceae bacterium]